MKRFVAPIAILILLLGAGIMILNNPPSSERRGPPTGPQTVVETTTVVPRAYQITVDSYGTVQPRTRSVLVAQVGGQIVSIKEDFRPGGYFAAGETLVTIDPRDYEADVRIAEATLMDALQVQAQEEARSEQALTDWDRLGDADEKPSDLVLRIPQLEAAKARVSSARSALTKAKLDLERSAVTAPFAGRVLNKNVDLGQVVNPGTQLAEIYATDYVEIRLPVRNADLGFVDLPEEYTTVFPSVTVSSELGPPIVWQGRVIRTEGAIDDVARQLHVVAQINDPFGTASPVERPLKIGEYVTAKIAGKQLDNVVVIPNNTIYQNSYVYVVQNGLLNRKDVEIAWQNGVESIISVGLNAGDTLVTTPLGQITSGTPVRIAGQPPKSEQTADNTKPPVTNGAAK